MSPIEFIDHYEYACRSAVMICIAFIAGFMIGAFVSDREVDDD